MNDLHEPNPGLFWETVTAFQRSAALRAAVDHDLFTAVAEGANTAAAAAEKRGIPERGVRILLDYFTIQGFLTKTDGRYALTEDTAAFLDRRSPAYLGGIIEFLQIETQREAFWDLTETVRRGTVDPDRPDALGAEHPMWIAYARAMTPFVAPAAEFIAGLVSAEPGSRMRTLDVAAGHGLFGVAVARAVPHAEIVAADWPGVLSVAAENARKAGISDRHALLPGDVFETDVGGDYDAVLVTNFFHHFDKAANVKLMRKLHAALRPGGRLFNLEFVPDEDRVTPPQSAAFPLVMLANTPAGDAYTFSEYDAMMREAGFGEMTRHEAPARTQSVLVSRKQPAA